MGTARKVEPAGQLANVSAALIVPGGEPTNASTSLVTERSTLLERLFEDVVLVIDSDMPFEVLGRVIERDPDQQAGLCDLALAFAAAREERVLVVAADLAGVTADLLLGLTAWPEHDCVAPRMGGVVQPLCALYRREAAMIAAQKELERGEPSSSAFLAKLDCGILEGNDLAVLLAPEPRLS